MRMLSPEETILIKEIILKHKPALLPAVGSIGVIPLTDELREELREVIADELVETGLGEDDEPNEKGLVFEKLIDILGHL